MSSATSNTSAMSSSTKGWIIGVSIVAVIALIAVIIFVIRRRRAGMNAAPATMSPPVMGAGPNGNAGNNNGGGGNNLRGLNNQR
jgi:hypothetical protein